MAKTNQTPQRKAITAKKSNRTVDVGERLTVSGEALTIRDLIHAHSQGFPLPSSREMLNPDAFLLNELIEDPFDLPDIESYSRLDITERHQTIQNLEKLRMALDSKIADQKYAYAQKDQDILNSQPNIDQPETGQTKEDS